MIFINHRINSLALLKQVPKSHGIELDIRYHENILILHHDPFSHHENSPEPFENICKNWLHDGPMILNIKTEGVELMCIELLLKYKITNWFFLDLSMPYFVIYAKHAKFGHIKGFTKDNLAVRFSEYEPIEYALSFKDKVSWVWIDCFTKLPTENNSFEILADAGFKLCLVSPELQRHSLNMIQDFKKQVTNKTIHAVCTKQPDLWK